MYGVTIAAAAAVVLTIDMAENEEKDIWSIMYRFDDGILMEDGICGCTESVSTCLTVYNKATKQ
jgi:hypothetical protein